MYITLKASSKNKPAAVKVFNALDRFFEAVENELPGEVMDMVAHGIDRAFETEGWGAPWADLKEYTQRERVRLGYEPMHPILYRTGDYHGSFVDFEHRHYDYYLSGEGGERSFVLKIGTTHPLFPWHEEGTRYMVARPATPFGDKKVFDDVCEDLREYLRILLEVARDA